MRSAVLIIDDEPAIRRLLVGALDRSGISHAEAASAGGALRLAKAQPAPLVALLDLGLPDRDGLEIVPQLAALGLAVIVLTARDATEEKVAALDLGADDFVTKPFDSEELLARVRSALRRKAGPPRSVDPSVNTDFPLRYANQAHCRGRVGPMPTHARRAHCRGFQETSNGAKL